MSIRSFNLKLKPVMRDYGCRNSMPHGLEPLYENKFVKVERCLICNKQVRFKKGWKGRVDNVAYLDAHARNFAQANGRTNRLYQKLYNHVNTKIVL